MSSAAICASVRESVAEAIRSGSCSGVRAEAIGAVGVGSMLFLAVAIFGMGLLLGLDTLVAQAFGAGEIGDCHRSLVQAFYVCLGVALIALMARHKRHEEVRPVDRAAAAAASLHTIPT